MSLPMTQPRAAHSIQDVERAMESFSVISESLLTSYNALEARAARVEEELAVSNRALETKVAELDAVLDALPVGVVVRNAEGRVLRVNQSLTDTLKIQAELTLGQREISGLTTARANEGRLILGDGTSLKLNLRRSEVRLRGGEAIGTVEIVDDRTELEELNERLHAMDKVAALGTMAGGIPHEIRNPLNAVAGFADMLQTRLGKSADEKAMRWSQLIARGAAEANAIITNLLTISTPEGLERNAIDPKTLIHDAVLAAQEGNGCPRSVVHIHADFPLFIGDRIKLRQALRNLIANAQDAAPGKDIIVSAGVHEGEITFNVSDAGPGIAPDLKRRVMDPFFTTRADGCGLGLALTNTIAELHGGRIEINDTPSELGGAQIALHLPLRKAHA